MTTELPPDYYDQYITASDNHWWFQGRERVLAAVVGAQVTLASNAIVVDVGCGPGGPTRALFPNQRIVALDLSSRVLSAYGSVTGIIGDAGDVPLRSESVGAICAFDVLEHLEDDRRALRGWHAALSAGGWLVMTVPAYGWLWSAGDDVDRHYRRYERGALVSRLTEAGFDVVRASYFNTILLPGIALIKWAARVLPSHGADAGRNPELDVRLPAWIERGVGAMFGAEAAWLRRHNLPAGVSIVALARR